MQKNFLRIIIDRSIGKISSKNKHPNHTATGDDFSTEKAFLDYLISD
jgi:hypothetical protein